MSAKFFELRRSIGLILLMVAAGFGATLLVYYPGVMTYDAGFVYDDIAKGKLGDWQSPAMSVLWAAIDPVAPGSASMFLLIATLYWLAFAVLALTVARRAPRLALALPVLALSPPAFVFVGTIWRDVLLAALWLLAAALAFAVAERRRCACLPVQALALALIALGVLLRPNALFAAPILGAYVLWPRCLSWKGAAVLYVPAVVGLYALLQVVYYDILGAARQHGIHSIMVFDLGGIGYFTQANQFPGPWTSEESAVVTGCYAPTEWDIYWWQEPCKLVMQRLESENLFGSPKLVEAWRHAVVSHPAAYLHHRAAFMWNFLAGANLTMWTVDTADKSKTVFADNPAFMAVKAVHDALKPTPLFRAGTWLILDALVCALAWRRRATAPGAFALGVGASAVVYMLTFFAVGVAADFRYAYWAVLAGLTGAVAAAATPRP